MIKHTKLFYRAVARIKAVNEKEGAVLLSRLSKKLGINTIRAVKLKEELVGAGILREWNESDYKKLPKGVSPKGNILWNNVKKYNVPKEIQFKETARVSIEIKNGQLPKKIGDLK